MLQYRIHSLAASTAANPRDKAAANEKAVAVLLGLVKLPS